MGGTPGEGSAYLRIGFFLVGVSNYQSSHTLIMGRLMGKYSAHKNPCKNKGLINLYGGERVRLTPVL